MPEISRFFGIVIKMFFDDHNPPHFHAEYVGWRKLSVGSRTSSSTLPQIIRAQRPKPSTAYMSGRRYCRVMPEILLICISRPAGHRKCYTDGEFRTRMVECV